MPKSIRSRRHRALIAVLVDTRKSLDMSQREFARVMGVSQSFIAQIESGQRRLDVAEFFDFARALDVDAVELFARVARR
jgi:transcriptional regulator with XRE-family HTH domain